jgi:Gluconate 2-dehydrogenase subunit 3
VTKIFDIKYDRRQWLKHSAKVLGASLLPAPGIVSAPAEAEAIADTSGRNVTAAEPLKSRALTSAQYTLVVELSETIIPADRHSGGAKAAKVADYIEQVLSESADEGRQSDWREGLRLVDLMSLHYNGKSFMESGPEERVAILSVLSDNNAAVELPEVRMFNDLRELTLRGYYTSKIGIHDELDYKGNVYLTEFVGCDDQGTMPE